MPATIDPPGAVPLRPDQRWPHSLIALLEGDRAAAGRAGDSAKASAAAANLAAEEAYLAAFALTLLHYAFRLRPHEATAALMPPLDGLRDTVLDLQARVELLEATIAEWGAH